MDDVLDKLTITAGPMLVPAAGGVLALPPWVAVAVSLNRCACAV